jgi:hypothetical protein
MIELLTQRQGPTTSWEREDTHHNAENIEDAQLFLAQHRIRDAYFTGPPFVDLPHDLFHPA